MPAPRDLKRDTLQVEIEVVPTQNPDPDVLMMQAAKDRNCRDGAEQ
jgi:hypothetical protein